MTQDEIIEMVRDVGLDWHKGWTLEDGEPNRFEAFAKLVAQHEREACAKVCDDIRHYNLLQETDDWIEGTKDCANAIRARGDHD